MFITLTNAYPKFKGEKIAIHVSNIVTVHRSEIEREDGTKEDVTFVHCPPHGTWEVEETLDEVLDLIQGC